MSNRAAYRLLAALTVFAIGYELLLSLGPGAHAKTFHLWMVWHRFYLPMLGLATLPFVIGYNFPLVKRLGGTKTALGNAIFFLSLGMINFAVLGTFVLFVLTTCDAWPGLSCSYPLGYVQYPSLAHVGFGITYPLVSLGIISLYRVLGVTRSEALRSSWIFLVVLGVELTITMPFGFGVAFDDATLTSAHAMDTFTVISGSVVLTLAIVAIKNARELAGGLFMAPTAALLAGFVAFGVGDIIQVHTNVTGRFFEANDPSQAPYTIAFILWVIGFLLFGRAVERMMAPQQ